MCTNTLIYICPNGLNIPDLSQKQIQYNVLSLQNCPLQNKHNPSRPVLPKSQGVFQALFSDIHPRTSILSSRLTTPINLWVFDRLSPNPHIVFQQISC